MCKVSLPQPILKLFVQYRAYSEAITHATIHTESEQWGYYTRNNTHREWAVRLLHTQQYTQRVSTFTGVPATSMESFSYSRHCLHVAFVYLVDWLVFQLVHTRGVAFGRLGYHVTKIMSLLIFAILFPVGKAFDCVFCVAIAGVFSSLY